MNIIKLNISHLLIFYSTNFSIRQQIHHAQPYHHRRGIMDWGLIPIVGLALSIYLSICHIMSVISFAFIFTSNGTEWPVLC